jgi:hypothetical protein
MITMDTRQNDAWALAGLLTGRYGSLALTRAAGEAYAAEREGDKELSALWYSVITHLRQAIGNIQTSGAT